MRRHIYIALALAAALAAACASLRPAVPVQEREVSEPQPQLEVIEGRPTSLVLGVSYGDAREGDVMQLSRGAGEGDLEAIAVVELKGRFLELASDSQIGLSDDALEVGESYRYRADVIRDETVIRSSDEISIEWDEAPTRPESVTVEGLTSRVVEIRWEPAGAGVVFMRDVLRPEAGTARFDVPEVAGGVHTVTGLQPEGVYAFRVALGEVEQEFVRFGTPSEEVYVTLQTAK